MISKSAGRYGRRMPGAPVILVHGFASSFERNWREPGWVDLLADAGRTVIPFDLPGHGDAAKPHDPAAYDDLASALEAVLPDEPVAAVGFSLGARTLLTLAARRPERFRALVVGGVGANLLADQDTRPLADAIESGVEPAHPLAAAFVRFAHTPGHDPRALAACMRRVAPAFTAEQLGSVACPTLVVVGERDQAAPAEPLAALLPAGRAVTVKGIDHLGLPKAFPFIDATLEFLDNHA